MHDQAIGQEDEPGPGELFRIERQGLVQRQGAEIERLTGVTQPALSQQLAELRRASLVMTRRDAKLVFYSLADEDVRTCVATMEHMLAGAEAPVPTAQGKASPTRKPVENAKARSDPSLGAAAFARVG